MVAKEFVEELRGVRRTFRWICDYGRIRARVKFGRRALLLDPVGALCYSKTGSVYAENDWFRAAEDIGLSHMDAADIMAAANHVSAHPSTRYIETLRAHMMQAVLLRPEEVSSASAPATASSREPIFADISTRARGTL